MAPGVDVGILFYPSIFTFHLKVSEKKKQGEIIKLLIFGVTVIYIQIHDSDIQMHQSGVQMPRIPESF